MSERQKAEAVAAGTSTRVKEQLRALRKHLHSLEVQEKELTTQFTEKQQAAEVAAGTEFQALEEAAKQAQDTLTEAQANLAVCNDVLFLICFFSKSIGQSQFNFPSSL